MIQQACYKDLNLNNDDLAQWVTHFRSEKRIKEQADMLKKLDKDLFENERIDEINFSEQLPAKLDSKLYIAIYRKIWATIRHDMHERIMAKRQELNIMSETEPLPQSEFVKI